MWPSETILIAVVILWEIFVGIDKYMLLMKELVQGPLKQILVSLAIQYIENNCSATWGDTCSSCDMVYWHILQKVFGVIANCLISSKVKDFNSHVSFREDNSRKAKKFKKD